MWWTDVIEGTDLFIYLFTFKVDCRRQIRTQKQQQKQIENNNNNKKSYIYSYRFPQIVHAPFSISVSLCSL